MNITDAFDSYLTAKIKVGQWEKEFTVKFYKPVIDSMINVAMTNARNPDMFDQDVLNSRLSPGAQQKLRGE